MKMSAFTTFHSVNFSEYRSAELPKFKVFAGTIQVIIASDNYLVLTFCELIPRQQLFSIILARHSNSLSMEVCIQGLDLRETHSCSLWKMVFISNFHLFMNFFRF